jgi:hypothetical protein
LQIQTLVGDSDQLNRGLVFHPGEKVEETVTVVFEQEFYFVEHYHCVDGSGPFLDLSLEIGCMVPGVDWFLGE